MAVRATAAIRHHMLHEQTVRQADELRERADEQRFLAEATKVLAASLDYEGTLDKLAQLVVPKLADWCVVDLLDGNAPSRAAIAHKDHAKLGAALAWSRRYPVDWEADGGPARVLRTGEPELVAEITDDSLAAAAHDADHLAALRALQLRSYLAVPLVARGRTLGVVTLLSDSSRRSSAIARGSRSTTAGFTRRSRTRSGCASRSSRSSRTTCAIRSRRSISPPRSRCSSKASATTCASNSRPCCVRRRAWITSSATCST
jgi:transcriptional regulator with GAF, ATPase, and Fis domain